MNTREWTEKIAAGGLDREFSLLYGEAEKPRERHRKLLATYEARFGLEDVVLLSAPGRTELAGNHTDHQQGMVLCGSVTQDTLAAAAPAEDGEVTILSDGFGEIRLTLDGLSPREEEKGTSAALVRGVAAALRELGRPVGGFRAAVTSDVPAGGGLSSSASFDMPT
jgi:galactokinase